MNQSFKPYIISYAMILLEFIFDSRNTNCARNKWMKWNRKGISAPIWNYRPNRIFQKWYWLFMILQALSNFKSNINESLLVTYFVFISTNVIKCYLDNGLVTNIKRNVVTTYLWLVRKILIWKWKCNTEIVNLLK